MGGFSRTICPRRVESAAIAAPHQAPKSRAADMCMMNDVEPFAESRNCVFRLSRSIATRTKVAIGHQPGNGRRICQTVAPVRAAAVATDVTNRCNRKSRAIG